MSESTTVAQAVVSIGIVESNVLLSQVILLFLFALQGEELASGFEIEARIPSAGLVVAIDPDLLFGEGLARSWNQIDDSLGKRSIRSKPFSKTNFTVKPMVSVDCAVLELNVDGTSVGESKSNSKTVEIVTDSLTKYCARQTLFVNTNGVASSAPVIDVKTNQSLNRTKSKRNPFGNLITRSVFKKMPDDINAKAEVVARRQVEQQLHASISKVVDNLTNAIHRFSSKRPAIAQLPWIFSSDSRKVYLTAFSDDVVADTLPNNDEPITIYFHRSLADQLLQQRIGGREFDSEQIETFYRQTSSNAKLPELDVDKQKPWTVKFENTPSKIDFAGNAAIIELATEKFKCDNRVLPAMKIKFAYEFELEGSAWHLKRSEHVTIAGDRTGARQQMLRSIMRKRFERLLPMTIAIPEVNLDSNLKRNNLDLGISRISPKDHFLMVSLKHK